MEQLAFEGMPRRLYSCTPTRLTTWLDCPRRYRMNYLDRPIPQKGAPWAHKSLGASVHNALAGWWRLPLARRTVEAAGALLVRGWIREGFADDAQSEKYRDWAQRMVEAYVAMFAGEDVIGPTNGIIGTSSSALQPRPLKWVRLNPRILVSGLEAAAVMVAAGL